MAVFTQGSERRVIITTCKLGEKGCWKDGKCHYSRDCGNKVLTNADRIREMSDEELTAMSLWYEQEHL